ncbi:DNA helicase [Tanacetum coccineum]|uniref:ATP-dependent DNA helicase n=1 Tax=Tanacetum coccineum TaxID=301880 RepID=A0ABQ4XI47_9ASTR
MALSPSQEYFPYGTVELSRANGPKFKVEYGHPRQAHFWRELPTLGLPGIEVDIIKKTENQAKMNKTEHGMEKTVQNQGQTVLYTIEFQKQGLPHCHTLIWVDSSNKIKDATQIDDYISAALPNLVEDPIGYKVVTELMRHGPCGVANLRPDRILRKIDRHVGNTSSSTVEKHIHVDEIKNYVDGRFVCSFEACWRIFDCPIHHREPAAQILNVHLENMQRVNFREKDRLNVIVNMPDKKKTTLIEWYVYNNQHTDGRHLTYLDFPFEFVWYADSKSWHKRMIRTKKSIGRLTYVRPNSSYLFYFKKLLSHQKGCKSPVEVRTINGQVLPTYQAACGALGLLEDDKEWDIAVEESGKVSEATGILNYHLNTPELQGYTLYELEAILNGFGMSVKEFGLPTPLKHLLKDLKNKLLMEEKNYRLDVLLQESALSVPKLNEEQKQIYNLIMNASEQSQHEMLFIYAVASSGIASLLLPAGRTSHSRFKLPLKLTDESVCHAKKHSQLGNLLVETNLIIWDEALMIVKRCFEALDRTLRD